MHTPGSTEGPLRSEFANDPDMAELVREFVAELGPRADQILRLHQASDLAELRRMAHQLKGSAGGYGFAPIGVAASKVEDLLIASASAGKQSVEQLRLEVEALVGLCRRAMDS